MPWPYSRANRGQEVASGAALPVRIYDALDRKLAELIRKYLRLIEQRPDR
ncbi:hypothetical protein [Nocardia sp. NPDC057440]